MISKNENVLISKLLGRDVITLNENNTIPSGLTGINWGDIRNINSGLVKYQSRAENARNNLTAGGKHIFNDGGLE